MGWNNRRTIVYKETGDAVKAKAALRKKSYIDKIAKLKDDIIKLEELKKEKSRVLHIEFKEKETALAAMNSDLNVAINSLEKEKGIFKKEVDTLNTDRNRFNAKVLKVQEELKARKLNSDKIDNDLNKKIVYLEKREAEIDNKIHALVTLEEKIKNNKKNAIKEIATAESKKDKLLQLQADLKKQEENITRASKALEDRSNIAQAREDDLDERQETLAKLDTILVNGKKDLADNITALEKERIQHAINIEQLKETQNELIDRENYLKAWEDSLKKENDILLKKKDILRKAGRS